MSEYGNCPMPAIADLVPTEIYCQIFKLLTAPQLMKCRAVCTRWKQIIDDITTTDDFWNQHCDTDFKETFEIACIKRRHYLTPRYLYRSLSLWSKLRDAEEDIGEFSPANTYCDEIRSCTVLRCGLIAVHKRAAIVYYDIVTLMPVKGFPNPIHGQYEKYTENDHVIVLLSNNLLLFVIRKLDGRTPKITCDNVKTYILHDHTVYYVDMNNDLYMVKVDNVTVQKFVAHCDEGIISMGYTNKQLHVLTGQPGIFTLNNDSLQLAVNMDTSTNLLEILHKYNMLQSLDWRLFFQWMFLLNRKVPQGPLRDIIVIRAYGNVVFVGTNWGVLRIYYRPYYLGQFDIFNCEPVKQYNFMERFDCPVLPMCQILSIDCMEDHDGHTLFIGMPKKVAIITYTHNFKSCAASDELEPQCEEAKPVEFVNLD